MVEVHYDYDNEDFWLWYNDEVSPAIWQYWYEPISSNYGEYGWMEHDSDGWWIETSYGNWEKVPEKYSQYINDMYYIDD